MNAIAVVYLFTAAAATLYASFELRILLSFLVHREALRRAQALPRASTPKLEDHQAPTLTIQIPLYNERTVADVAIRAAAAQDYPRERLTIQVLDDSTDDTRDKVATLVSTLRAQGVRIEHLHREVRTGYKAGALMAGLARTDSELVAIFDADFSPAPDFARRIVLEQGAFEDPEVAFVQARWAFVNTQENLLTSAQSLLIDRHFFVQKPTWQHLGRVTMFNGSGGIWRKRAIEDGGGFSADTLTEDLDLSYRVALRGWRGVYLPEIATDSELPSHLLAFKLQQRRWARGCAQAVKKLAPKVLSARQLRSQKDELFVLFGYAVHPLILLNTLLWPWAVLYTQPYAVFLVGQLLLSVATLVGPVSFAVSAREVGRPLSLTFARDVLFATLLGMGLMVNNTFAHLSGYFTRQSEFQRTPKASREREVPGYTLTLDWTLGAELCLLFYCIASAVLLVREGQLLWVPPCLVWVASLSTMVALQLLPEAPVASVARVARAPAEKRTS